MQFGMVRLEIYLEILTWTLTSSDLPFRKRLERLVSHSQH